MSEQLSTALAEFWHVGSVLFVLIAVISVVTGFIREYIPQEKLQKHQKNQPPVKGAIMGAAMSLLIGGTGASAPELAILSSMLKPRGLLVFVLTIFIIATAGGFLFMLI